MPRTVPLSSVVRRRNGSWDSLVVSKVADPSQPQRLVRHRNPAPAMVTASLLVSLSIRPSLAKARPKAPSAPRMEDSQHTPNGATMRCGGRPCQTRTPRGLRTCHAAEEVGGKGGLCDPPPCSWLPYTHHLEGSTGPDCQDVAWRCAGVSLLSSMALVGSSGLFDVALRPSTSSQPPAGSARCAHVEACCPSTIQILMLREAHAQYLCSMGPVVGTSPREQSSWPVW